MKIVFTPCFFLSIFLTLVPVGDAQETAGQEAKVENAWTPLFNGKNLDGFDTFLGMYTEDQFNEDPENIVTVREGMIHIYRDTPQGSKVPFGYFATQEEYSHYHLRFEYQWGEKKFAPRTEVLRDSGVIYHMVGPHGVWPRGVECQVQEGDTGDTFTVMGTQVTTTVDSALLASEPPLFQYLPSEEGGVTRTRGTAVVTRIKKSKTVEEAGWNTVEVIVRGSENFVHIVNGVVNNRGTDIRQLDEDGETWVPLAKGKILFQVEGAEVFYRNIEIKELPESEKVATSN